MILGQARKVIYTLMQRRMDPAWPISYVICARSPNNHLHPTHRPTPGFLYLLPPSKNLSSKCLNPPEAPSQFSFSPNPPNPSHLQSQRSPLVESDIHSRAWLVLLDLMRERMLSSSCMRRALLPSRISCSGRIRSMLSLLAQ